MRPRALTTRAKRRLTDREAAKATLQFTKIVRAFETALFDESVKPGLETYQAIYDKHDRQWRRMCEELKKKLKIVVSDEDFFQKHFKPQVAVA
ncbi:hypothetical protein ACWKW6_12830 [Dyadobacter jiangsuensis]